MKETGDSTQKRFYTTGEAAKFCGVTLRTIINWINKGILPAHKLPGTRGDNRISFEDLITFMQKKRIPIPESLDLSQKKLTALIIDDDEYMSRTLGRIIKASNFEVYYANNGFEAGFLYATHTPTLMTLNLQMTNLDGLALLASLEEDRTCKVIVISAVSEESLHKALLTGADAALCKPFENETLSQLVESLTNNSIS